MQITRLNTIGTPLVTRPEPGMEVDAARPVRPIDVHTPGVAPEPPRPAGAPAPPVAPVAPAPERRRQSRREADRRERQLPVLIDTRVADRRTLRRREEDAPPPRIDVSA